jgi:RimJ/RimL family protein N-acetyltransferase
VLEPTYPIETERLILRPFESGDSEPLLAILSDPDVMRFLETGPEGPDGVRRSLETKLGRWALRQEGDWLQLAVVPREGGAMIGFVTLIWVSREHRLGEIGFIFHPAHHGKGYAAEAADVMLSLGFEELGLHRIIGRCDARNAASARLLERLGLRREAHLVENELIKGAWTDELVFAMLDREWRTRPGPRLGRR